MVIQCINVLKLFFPDITNGAFLNNRKKINIRISIKAQDHFFYLAVCASQIHFNSEVDEKWRAA
jgi:hypothetical protein